MSLKFHPLADIFPLMEGAEFDALVADIKAHGLREKIDLYQGKIVEGRNRYRALQRLGIDPSADPGKYFRKAIYAHTVGGEIAPHEQNNDDRVRAYVISKNIHRRHLTPEQKRDLIAKVIAAKPEASDRRIAKQVKADHKTVGAIRRAKESTGEVSPVAKRVGADGKARKQPAQKKTAPTKTIPSQVQRELEAKDAHIDELETAREHDKDLAEKLRAAEIKIAGLESEVEELKAENARLRAELEAKQETATEKQGAAVMPKRGRGRPQGSKNRPKPPPADEAAPPQRGEDNAPAPEEGAEIMKAKMAALDDGIPESLRRAPA